MSKKISRRQFAGGASSAAALGAIAPYWVTGAPARAAHFQAKNDRPLVAAVGVGGRGWGITQEAARFGDVAAVCDVDLQRAERAKAALGGKPAVFQDYRKLLDAHPEIDVIVNGTPDHWHTAVNVAACRAGKDVYTEKPLTPTLDWELWQGQAPERPYCPERCHFSFRFWSEYAGGKMTDWGQHHMDIAFWGMGIEDSGPLEVEAKGFFPNHGQADCYDNADRFVAHMKYPGDVEMYYLVVRDKRYLKSMADGDMTEAEDAALFAGVPDEWKREQRDGIMFIGDRGRVFANRGKAHGKAVEELAANPLPSDAVRLYASDNHMGNFFECVQSRKQPISTVAVAHRVITACHLANVSMHLGRKIAWDPQQEQIVGDAEAAASPYVRREQRKPYALPG